MYCPLKIICIVLNIFTTSWFQWKRVVIFQVMFITLLCARFRLLFFIPVKNTQYQQIACKCFEYFKKLSYHTVLICEHIRESYLLSFKSSWKQKKYFWAKSFYFPAGRSENLSSNFQLPALVLTPADLNEFLLRIYMTFSAKHC